MGFNGKQNIVIECLNSRSISYLPCNALPPSLLSILLFGYPLYLPLYRQDTRREYKIDGRTVFLVDDGAVQSSTIVAPAVWI
jgi:hypothetical protein